MGLVGTEAAAATAMQANAKNFSYPAAGFQNPIEHSLLYNMLSSPHVFPPQAVKDAIVAEDFSEYLATNELVKVLGIISVDSSSPQHQQQQQQHVCSYAQLSALLTLSAEKWPPPDNMTNTDNSINSNDSIDFSDEQQQQQQPPPPPPLPKIADDKDSSVPQVLCKHLLQTVIKHAAEHDLDREREVQELLEPLERLHRKKGNNLFLKLILPAYVGYAASIVTANPLPLLLGTMATQVMSVNMAAKEHRESSNLHDFQTRTNRMADAETTSLLDETH